MLTLSWLTPLLEHACECAGKTSFRSTSESPVPDSQGHADACLVLYNRDNGCSEGDSRILISHVAYRLVAYS